MACLQLRLSPVPYLFSAGGIPYALFSKPQWAFALLASQEILTDEVERTVLQVFLISRSKMVGLNLELTTISFIQIQQLWSLP